MSRKIIKRIMFSNTKFRFKGVLSGKHKHFMFLAKSICDTLPPVEFQRDF